MPFYVNTQKPDSSREIARLLGKCIKRHKRDWTEIVFLCIGSDRVTGDCLGPYVGYRLSQHQLPGIFVYGTLNQPVHAVNLSDITDFISKSHPFALVIAIDASLGDEKHLGYVTIGNGSLYPRCGCSERSAACGGYLYYWNCKYCRNSGISDFTDNKTVHCDHAG